MTPMAFDIPGRKERQSIDYRDLLNACWANEFPLRRPENSYRVCAGRLDVLNHFLPDRHEQFNETATLILELCNGRHSLIDIWRSVLDAFKVPDESSALHDTVRMVRYFQRFHIVYPSTIDGEQHVDVRHPRNIPTTSPVAY